MKNNRLLGLLLCVAMILSTLSGCGNNLAEQTETEDATINTQEQTVINDLDDDAIAQTEETSVEVSRAIAYGLVPESIQGDYDQPITFRQYSEMLTRMIRAYDESLLESWEKTIAVAAQTDDEMLREDGILATAYAMAQMGKVEYSGNDWSFIDQIQTHMDDDNITLSWDYPFFSDWENIAFEWVNGNYMWGGIIMCAIEKSRVSGLAVYPYDFEDQSAHLSEPLTREEAICAVLRLSETEEDFSDNLLSMESMDFSASKELETKVIDLTEKRKQSILNSNESVPCTGTAYYISNSGDDSNDGLSPETPWATLDRLKQQSCPPGGCVYFERGGVWRGAVGYYYDGVTIAAYGQGDKPRIYGSPENGADQKKWELYAENNDVKIWKYLGISLETAGIVLNDGEKVAKRVYAWYNGENFFDSTDMVTPFDMMEALNENLLFCCEINIEKQEMPFYPDPDEIDYCIYMRCDEGNPGEVFESIEFISKPVTEDVAMIAFGPNGMLDNVCIMYNAGTAVSVTEYDNFTIQNCEIGWCGTRIESFFVPENGEPGIWTDGNAIQIIGSNCTVQNNYIHDIDGGGISLELGGDISARAPFSGNVIRDRKSVV